MLELVSQSVLWLYVIVLGISCGAGVYEARISVPSWFQFTDSGQRLWNPGAVRAANVGLRFWAFVTTGPLTLLTLTSCFVIQAAPAPAQGFWWGSVAITVLERAMTFTYFVPTMIALMNAPHGNASVTARALQWLKLDHIRLCLAFAAWLAALNALART